MNYIKVLELLCLCVGLIRYKKLDPSYLRCVVAIVAITVIQESLVVNIIKLYSPTFRNLTYNIFSFFEMFVWLGFFYVVHRGHQIAQIIIPVGIVIAVYSLIELNFLKNWESLHTNSYRIYELFVLVLSFAYLVRLLKKDSYHPTFSDSIFWVCSACIIFHAMLMVNFTVLVERNYWNLKNSRELFNFLHNIGNTFYYLLLCVSFLTGSFFRSR